MGGVEVTTVERRLIAAVRRRATVETVPKVLIPGLTAVWAVVRSRGIAFGRNVAVYRDAGDGQIELLCGVEIADRFQDDGEVVCLDTPTGTAALATHVGPYRRLPATYRAIAGWMREHRHRAIGASMEVYGHWVEDETRLQTEVYVFLRDE